ncbi:hypothetical protein BGX27_002221 [Mortierella sp. AM989]|nr:hypothetical protein BGX27_002221 [Mortierella sp. AM989]
MSIEALFAGEIKKVDVADVIATFGVFAPYAPTDRMRSVFGETRLESVAPTVRLQVEEEYDMIEHLPLDKESRIAEETSVATYIAPILLGTLKANEKVSNLHPFKGQGMRPDRPDIVAKIGGRELLLGEVTGPCQETYSAKNAWDLYRLARFGKSLLGDNPFAPLMQIVHTKGVYMRLTIKERGMFLLERVGTFVIPIPVDMLPSLLGTVQTLSAAKDDLAILLKHKPGNRKRSWDFPDLPIAKKLLV